MECKSGYKDYLGQLKEFCDNFITEAQQYATWNPGYFFVAAFVCEYPFDDGQMQCQFGDGNLSTMVKVVDEMAVLPKNLPFHESQPLKSC